MVLYMYVHCPPYLNHFPSPVPVLLVMGDPPEDEVGLHGLWTEQVHLLVVSTVHVSPCIKPESLRTKLCG